MGMEITQTPGTMGAKGNDYVANWPAAIARKFNLSPEHIANAMQLAGVATEADSYRLRHAFLAKEATSEVAALTPENARKVMTELKAISAEIQQAVSTTCRHCGLALYNGECEQCGESLV